MKLGHGLQPASVQSGGAAGKMLISYSSAVFTGCSKRHQFFRQPQVEAAKLAAELERPRVGLATSGSQRFLGSVREVGPEAALRFVMGQRPLLGSYEWSWFRRETFALQLV